MTENQYQSMEGLENVINKLWILPFTSIERISPHPHKVIGSQAMRNTFSGNTCKSICAKKHLISNVIAARNQKNTYLIFGPLYLAMYYTGSVNWMEVF